MELFLMSLITLSALHNGVDVRLALSVAYIESGITNNYKPEDGNSASYGPMQVKRVCAKQVGMPDANLMNPTESVEVGVRYLKYNLDRCNQQIECALAAYNSGKISKRNSYSERVLKSYWRF